MKQTLGHKQVLEAELREKMFAAVWVVRLITHHVVVQTVNIQTCTMNKLKIR